MTEAQSIKIIDNTTSAPLPRSLRINSAVQERDGLSMQALVKALTEIWDRRQLKFAA